MRIANGIFLDPDRNTAFGTVAIALTFFIFAYSSIFGKLTIIVFYALWLPFFGMKPKLLLGQVHRIALLLLLPGLAILSTLWSDHPDVTLRASLQYCSTIVCGLIAGRMISIETLAKGGLAGVLAILCYSLAYGGYRYDVIDGTYSFAGAFGSKNSFGFFASMGLVFALAIIWLFRSGLRWAAIATVVAAVSAYSIQIADSATATLTTLGALSVIAAAKFTFAFSPTIRRAVLAIWLVAVTIVLAVAYADGLFWQLFEAFGRDATLTGRSYLWAEGLKFADDRPLAGTGYYAFWVHGRPLAEELWDVSYITSRSGFNFHNTLIESYVELGLAGVTMVGAILLALLVVPLRVLMNRRHAAGAILCTVLAVIFVVRSIVEVEFFTPYKVGSFLVPFLILAMADARGRELREIRSRVYRPLSPLKPGATVEAEFSDRP